MMMMMENFRLATVLLLTIVLSLPLLIHCDDAAEDRLLQGINSFRQTSKLPALTKQDKAGCVADEIANKLEDTQCTSNTKQSQVVSSYPDVLKKCGVDANTTRDGIIIPVCVPHRVETLVLTNYTQSQNAKYLNDSRYTSAGIGTEDDWTVLVLTMNTPGGSFASGVSRVAACIGSGHSLVSVLLIMFLSCLY